MFRFMKDQKKCSKYTDEEKAERARISTINYHYIDIEKERKRKRVDYHSNKYRLNNFPFGYHFYSPCKH